jgi:hypothetical protein
VEGARGLESDSPVEGASRQDVEPAAHAFEHDKPVNRKPTFSVRILLFFKHVQSRFTYAILT